MAGRHAAIASANVLDKRDIVQLIDPEHSLLVELADLRILRANHLREIKGGVAQSLLRSNF
jgi:hypothetical protein